MLIKQGESCGISKDMINRYENQCRFVAKKLVRNRQKNTRRSKTRNGSRDFSKQGSQEEKYIVHRGIIRERKAYILSIEIFSEETILLCKKIFFYYNQGFYFYKKFYVTKITAPTHPDHSLSRSAGNVSFSPSSSTNHGTFWTG